jgi:AraC-like DNA-binding protein
VPIAEVSYLLGYGEPSNFHRAFRRFHKTGLTVAEPGLGTPAGKRRLTPLCAYEAHSVIL